MTASNSAESSRPIGAEPDRVEPVAAEVQNVAPETAEELSSTALIEQLSADRLWLLRQIDGGRWPDLRLDLAALERELGQMIDLASERLTGS
ncbi:MULTISPECIES: hypothetical protein [Synechococcaceae]|uniref:hypothetical protein n=1 Tax=Synechococcaceae TaxID=1890426 RepID=UPI000AEA9EA3|nr:MULTISPECIES: hypothetical protein [Synechococcaceae]MCT4365768.1 hypothetical protein [Candidatus Regnicoccus frigidus MAG-AL1]MCT4366488.1 hypothetical protein [Candidatus Regnicoccus frigidus MAG-AL2]TWB91844.1 hypothetical protein FB106_10645 [Synechococcus sp. Ace-Pa]